MWIDELCSLLKNQNPSKGMKDQISQFLFPLLGLNGLQTATHSASSYL